MAVVATPGEGKGADERIRAVVRYERTGTETAEVAFVVDDALQGQGIAPKLLHLLAGYARNMVSRRSSRLRWQPMPAR